MEKRSKENVTCQFCKAEVDPSYKDYQTLKRYITDRAKITGKKRSYLCAKHQRRLSREIKRGRFLGLLPFTAGL